MQVDEWRGYSLSLAQALICAVCIIALHVPHVCAGTADEDFVFAMRLYQKEEFALAADELERFVKQHSKDERVPEALFILGDCNFRLKRYEQAAKAFERAAAEAAARGKREVEARATYWTAEAHYQMQRYDEAKKWYELVLRKFPKGTEAPYALYSLGLIARDMKRHEEALKYFMRCVAEFPESDVAPQCQWLIGECLFDLKRYEEAKAAYEMVIKRYPNSSEVADAMLGIAWVSFESGQYEEAAKFFGEVVARYPKTQAAMEAIVRQADCHFNLKRYEKALEIYRKVAEDRAHPFADHAIYWGGQCLLRMKQPQNAAAQFLLLIRTMPNSPYVARAHLALGEAYMAMERYDEAAKSLMVALERAKDERDVALIRVMLAECALKGGNVEGAIRELTNLAEMAFKEERMRAAVTSLIVALIRAGEFERIQKVVLKLKLTGEAAEDVALALLESGKVAYEKKEYDTAERIYKFVLEHFPQAAIAPATLFALGAVDFVRERFEDAANAYGELIKRFPNDKLVPEARYWRANSLWMLKRFNEAHEEFVAFINSGLKDEVKLATALYRDGLCLYELKRFDEAAAAFERLLKEYPNSELCDKALYQLGWVYIDAGKRAEALKVLERLINEHRKSQHIPEAHFLVGELLFVQKRFEEALAHYEHSVKLSSGKDEELSGKALYRLGWTLLMLKRDSDAMNAFEGALGKQIPEEIKSDALLQLGYLQFNARKFTQALTTFERLLKEFPNSPFTKQALLYKGRCLNELEKFADAEVVLQQFIERYPKDALSVRAQFELAWAKQNRKQFDAAIELYKAVAASDAGEMTIEAQFRIGECLLLKGDVKEALREFLRVALLYEDVHEWAGAAQFYAGLCYERLGEGERAEKSYRTVLEKYSQTKWADRAKERLKAMGKL
ncbi:MAG: tetratricopeptide repeat protein [Armatimonadetes bacterium]|nr:tetratricopeptide repeat protein [Armatimonadota bacterium]